MNLNPVLRIGAWLLAGIGIVLLLVALAPLGDAPSNVSFWVAAVGFDRLASLIPARADLWLAVIGIGAIAAAAVLLVIGLLLTRRPSAEGESGPRLDSFERQIVKSHWIFTFDPVRKFSRAVTFNPDGTIGEGQTTTEHRWAVSGRYVDILRESGLLQNRFELHAAGEKLNFVRDPRAMGPKGQYFRSA